MGESGQMASSWRSWIVPAGLLASGLLLALPSPDGMPEAAKNAAVIGALMALLWFSEAVPLAATALLPLAAFPLVGISGLDRTAHAYADPLIFLFMGGFILSGAIQRWRLHHRLAQLALSLSGRRPDALLLAIMFTTAFLSLWVSNTAAAMVMMPIAASVTGAMGREAREARSDPFSAALTLGIAYSATIGGMGSLIGTPPNALLAGYMQKTYGLTIGFGQWMLIGVPIVLVLLPITWLLLTRLAFRLPSELPRPAVKPMIARMSRPERIVLVVLVTTAAAWIARPFVADAWGWVSVSDAGIAITAVLVLFGLPPRWSGAPALLEWKDVQGIRWDVLLLFGGGLALADGVVSTGLATWIGAQVQDLSNLPILLVRSSPATNHDFGVASIG